MSEDDQASGDYDDPVPYAFQVGGKLYSPESTGYDAHKGYCDCLSCGLKAARKEKALLKAAKK